MANPNRCGTRGSVHFPAASRWRRQQRSSRICDGVPPMGQRTFLSPSPEAVWEPAAWPAFQTRLWNWSVPREGQRDEMDSIWKREFKCVRAVASETRGKVVPVRRKAEQLKWARSQTWKIKRGKAEPGAKFRDKKRLHRSKARHAILRSVPHSSFSAWSVAAERIKGASLARNLANTEHPPSSSSTSRRPIRKRSKAKRPSQEGLFSHTLSAHRARRA
ncbi:hypothetical protein pipiens_014217 [Culex pipiens pipiens]|uniref:Uncharacterized protein n=1 Tax=Culex pipiens pipiens TaxID=38569 RepID=A0ABD1CVF1_CULPP